MVAMAIHELHLSARQSSGFSCPKPTSDRNQLAMPLSRAKNTENSSVDAAAGVTYGRRTPIRQKVVPRSLRLSRLASIRAISSCGTVESTKMPNVLSNAFQKSESVRSLEKLAKPAQPFLPGSSRRQFRSATTPLKMIGKSPKTAKNRKNGAINRYGVRLLSKRYSQYRRCGGSGLASIGGAAGVRVRGTARSLSAAGGGAGGGRGGVAARSFTAAAEWPGPTPPSSIVRTGRPFRLP